jgi:peptidoglycan hydrolase-like protein with peptidoglycan-binding domain
MILKIGSQGPAVKKLQSDLRAIGLFNHKTDTGFYGPQTELAVKKYQRQRGIKIDGIYGPRTQHMLENEHHAVALINSPHIQGTHHQAVLKAMYSGGNHAINLGKGGIHVTPSDVVQLHKNMDDAIQEHYRK